MPMKCLSVSLLIVYLTPVILKTFWGIYFRWEWTGDLTNKSNDVLTNLTERKPSLSIYLVSLFICKKWPVDSLWRFDDDIHQECHDMPDLTDP